jgi:hypothetical protein
MYSGFVRHVVCNRLNFRFQLTSLLLPSRTTATCPKPLRAIKGKAASVGSKHFVDFKEVHSVTRVVPGFLEGMSDLELYLSRSVEGSKFLPF